MLWSITQTFRLYLDKTSTMTETDDEEYGEQEDAIVLQFRRTVDEKGKKKGVENLLGPLHVQSCSCVLHL